MKNWPLIVALFAVLFVAVNGNASEPNETFATRTILPAGALTVSDELTPGLLEAPDTFLGIRGSLGEIIDTDDDGSLVGNGFASGLDGVLTDSGSIRFAVTGVGDFGFDGSHSEFGRYRVFVDVYDSGGALNDAIRETRTLQSGMVDEYSFSDGDWMGRSYDVFIDNTVGGVTGADVDFFTFTGLTPGAIFTAQTLDPASSLIDTILGLFDSSGSPIALNDDDPAGGLLSLLTGVVPAGGALTFAVSGTGDDAFTGNHIEQAPYELKLTLDAGFASDFNGDGSVSGADLGAWQDAYPATASADADADGDSDGADFLIWQRQLGGVSAAFADSIAVPETSLIWTAAAGLLIRRRTDSRC
jgi:hypothetical protein